MSVQDLIADLIAPPQGENSPLFAPPSPLENGELGRAVAAFSPFSPLSPTGRGEANSPQGETRSRIWRIITPAFDIHRVTGQPETAADVLRDYPDAIGVQPVRRKESAI